MTVETYQQDTPNGDEQQSSTSVTKVKGAALWDKRKVFEVSIWRVTTKSHELIHSSRVSSWSGQGDVKAHLEFLNPDNLSVMQGCSFTSTKSFVQAVHLFLIHLPNSGIDFLFYFLMKQSILFKFSKVYSQYANCSKMFYLYMIVLIFHLLLQFFFLIYIALQ